MMSVTSPVTYQTNLAFEASLAVDWLPSAYPKPYSHNQQSSFLTQYFDVV